MTNVTCVFVVDADRSARIGLARLLRTAGHDIRDFARIDEFLEAICSGVSGCLVLDAGMPGISGEELRAEIVERGADLSIIAVATVDDPKTRRKAQEMKAAGFFRKPVDGTALLDAINWAMRSNTVDDNHSGAEKPDS